MKDVEDVVGGQGEQAPRGGDWPRSCASPPTPSDTRPGAGFKPPGVVPWVAPLKSHQPFTSGEAVEVRGPSGEWEAGFTATGRTDSVAQLVQLVSPGTGNKLWKAPAAVRPAGGVVA